MHFRQIYRVAFLGLLAMSACQKPSRPTVIIQEEAFAEHIRPTPFQTPEQQLKNFQLPEGFEITLFASEPQISKPMNIEFDQQGRLWVTQSSEYPYASELGKGKDKITILEDTDGDGKADRFTPFRDDLNIPIGLLPVADGVVTYSIPSIFYFKNADQTLKTSPQDELITGFGYKDTHGMINNLIRGFDGWVHACHGYSNTSFVKAKEGEAIPMTSGNTFRFTLDGSKVEQTTYGRVNPFGYAFDERGFLYFADCHSKPIYQLIPQASYPHFGNQPTGIGFGPEMMHYQLGSTAIAGLAFYTGGPFPKEYHQSFFTGDVVTSRVDRTGVSYVGSTPVAEKREDFLLSADPWFRPVDVKIGPDGALYVADFYNKIIGHYEVALDHPERDRTSGRIWRIAYKGSAKKAPTQSVNWSKASLHELLEGLNYPQLSIRMKAADQLVDVWKEKAIEPVQKLVDASSTHEWAKVQGLWILYRLHHLSAATHLRAFQDPSLNVRIHAIRIAGEEKTLSTDLHTRILQGLTDTSPFIQRVAAEVISKHPHFEHVQPLLTLYATTPETDTHLKYTTLLAIRHQLQDAQVLQQVATANWSDKDLAVLGQAVVDLKSTIAAQLLFKSLQSVAVQEEKIPSFYTFLGRQLPTSNQEEVIQFAQQRYASSPASQLKIFQALQKGIKESGNKPSSHLDTWGKQLATAIVQANYNRSSLSDSETEMLAEAIRLAGDGKMKELQASILHLFEHQPAANVKAAAAKTLVELDKAHLPKVAQLFGDASTDIATKEKLVSLLAPYTQDEVQQALLKGMIGTNRKLQTQATSALANSSSGIALLINAIEAQQLPADLLVENRVKEALSKNASAPQQAQINQLMAGSENARTERLQLIEQRIKGYHQASKDSAKGKELFLQNCSTCHQIKGSGNAIGPNLDGIGNWGVTALTEKILDPNRNISASFRTYQITLKDQSQLTGLYRRTEGEVMYFADASGQEFAVQKDKMERYEATPYTLMPDAFRHTFSENEYYHLLNYLLTIK